MRLASIAITMPRTANAYHVVCTLPCVAPVSRSIARAEMNRLTSERIAASASADRCSALPWPN